MNTCPECRGTGYVQLLTSKVQCKTCIAGAPAVAFDNTAATAQRYVTHQNAMIWQAGKFVPAKFDRETMRPGEVVEGPNYFARCCEDRMELIGHPFGHAGSVKSVRGEFVCDAMPEFDFDLSKYLPLIGRGFVRETSSQASNHIAVSFESIGPVYKA